MSTSSITMCRLELTPEKEELLLRERYVAAEIHSVNITPSVKNFRIFVDLSNGASPDLRVVSVAPSRYLLNTFIVLCRLPDGLGY